MIVPLSEASLAMHSASVGIRLKKNGIANLESNDELFPKNINFKPKFDVPEDLLNSDETKNAIAEFDKLIRDTMIKAKSLIVKQGHRTIRHMEEKYVIFLFRTLSPWQATMQPITACSTLSLSTPEGSRMLT